MTGQQATGQWNNGMCRPRLLLRVLATLVALPLVACGGNLTLPGPATLAAQANATAGRGNAIVGAGTIPAGPVPTTLTLTLGVPTTLTGGNPTRATGTPNPTSLNTATANTVRFTDPMNRFSFMRPANWQETKPGDPDIVTVFVASSPQGIFNVLAKPAPANMTLDQYYNASLSSLKTREKGYQDGPMGSRQSTLAGEPARQHDYFAMPSETNAYFVEWYCIHGGIIYQLTFDTPVDPTSNDMNVFNRVAQVVVDSWKFS